MDVWSAIAQERATLVDALDKLPDDAWDKPSLCAGWTVRDVVAHMVSTAQLTPAAFFAKLAGSRFSFQQMTRGEIARVHGVAGKPVDLVALLRERISTRNAPPGPAPSWLGETIVHGEDVFRALGAYRTHPVEHVAAVADFYSGSNLLIGTKRRIDGLTLTATDTTWTHGSGPTVTGPAIALLMAMTGRKTALDDLTGDGTTILRSRA
jgi:uncharacterized protein (TIGR03083 family)